MMEYKDFIEFYNNCNKIAYFARNHNKYGNFKKKISNIRDTYCKEFLNSYFCIARFPEEILQNITSNTKTIKISADSLIKNIIEHPEIEAREYMNIEKYILSAEYILVKNERNLIYFKIEDKIYQFVIKTTKDKNENFLTTFHKANIKQLKKDLNRYKQI